jgi:hypothetical protein
MTGTSQMQKTCVGINALSAHEVVISAGWLLSALLQESNPNWGKNKKYYTSRNTSIYILKAASKIPLHVNDYKC